jgi:hypothetical protein
MSAVTLETFRGAWYDTIVEKKLCIKLVVKFLFYTIMHGRKSIKLKHLLVLLTFFLDKLPDDGTLVPKHVAFGTSYEIYSVMYFILY